MVTTMNLNWAYAVPLDETNGIMPAPQTNGFRSRDSSTSAHREPRTGVGRTLSNGNAMDIMSDSEAAGSRRASIRASNASVGRKRSRNTLKDRRMEKTEERIDDSAWIHRDKLAQIEIQEMEEAGIPFSPSRRSMSAGPRANGTTSRSASRSGTRRPVSNDEQDDSGDEPYGVAYSTYDDLDRKRVSTIPAGDEEELELEPEPEPEPEPERELERELEQEQASWDPHVDSEIRTPQEIAAEQQTHRQHQVRPSTSRIPVSKASPVPVPQTVVDRDSPLPRSRHGSNNFGSAWDETQYARRARSGSVGSQVLLDDQDGVKTPPRPASKADENSPPKSRAPNKSGPTSGARKGHQPAPSGSLKRPPSSHQLNGRTGSDAANKRPASRGGHRSRPSTSHAPEGEAPWIASMYKPDPRLPPDQQMLPTHAKRMMQEQWEKEGKTGSAYDRDFKLLNDDEFQKPSKPLEQNAGTDRPSGQHLNLPTPDRNSQASDPSATKPWPLSPTKSDEKKRESGSPRPGTSGGYRITPTISTPPAIHQRFSGSQQSARGSVVNTSANPPVHVPPRMPDVDEKQAAEPAKGCCCIVM